MVSHIWSATGLGPLMEAGCRKFDCVHPMLLPGRHLTMRSLRTPLMGKEVQSDSPGNLLGAWVPGYTEARDDRF